MDADLLILPNEARTCYQTTPLPHLLRRRPPRVKLGPGIHRYEEVSPACPLRLEHQPQVGSHAQIQKRFTSPSTWW